MEARPDSVVLDTSMFTNPATSEPFGPDTGAALTSFLGLARLVPYRLRFYMPPSVLDELKTFVDPERLPDDLELVIRLQAPKRYDVYVPGTVLYELIEDIRVRINRGLRVAEEAVREVHPKTVDKTIARLREKYRVALRAGLLDSIADVDVVLLALELEGAVVSSDTGLVAWAQKLGVRIIHPTQLRGILDHLVEDYVAGEESRELRG